MFLKLISRRKGHASPAEESLVQVAIQDRLKGDEPDYKILPAKVAITTSFTEKEKVRFYQAARTLAYTPRTGPLGSWLTKIAQDVAASMGRCTRQYVMQVLYPGDPAKIFTTRTPTYKAVWTRAAILMEEAMTNPAIRTQVEIMTTLEKGIGVIASGLRTDRARLLESAIILAGFVVKVCCDMTRSPYTYLLIPSGTRRKRGLGQVSTVSTPFHDVCREYKEVELVETSRGQVDLLFPGWDIQRPGKNHYKARPAAA